MFDDIRRRSRAAWLEASTPPVAGTGRLGRLQSLPRFARIALSVFVALILYYGLIGWLIQTVDADLTLRPAPAALPPGGSVTVGMAAAVIDREVNDHAWTPNDPFFFPTALLDNMPAFQRGIRAMTAQLVRAIQGRIGGSDDPDLSLAVDGLMTPPDRWWLQGNWPFVGTSAESAYRDAVEALHRYNARLGQRQARLSPDAATLAAILQSLAAQLDAAATATGRQVGGRGEQSAERAVDVQFYEVKGQAYAAALFARALRDDYGAVIRQRQLAGSWAEATDALDAAVRRAPVLVDQDDLALQGFQLLLARDRLREISRRLQG